MKNKPRKKHRTKQINTLSEKNIHRDQKDSLVNSIKNSHITQHTNPHPQQRKKTIKAPNQRRN